MFGRQIFEEFQQTVSSREIEKDRVDSPYIQLAVDSPYIQYVITREWREGKNPGHALCTLCKELVQVGVRDRENGEWTFQVQCAEDHAATHHDERV